jgi:hypothetical protein
MRFSEFSYSASAIWNGYLSWAVTEVHAQPGHLRLFPTMLACVETTDFFVAELVGASQSFNGLDVRKIKEPVMERYFHQFTAGPADAMMAIENIGYLKLCGMRFTQTEDEAAVQHRFPWVSFRDSYRFDSPSTQRPPLSIRRGVQMLVLGDCLFINRRDSFIRLRDVAYATVVARDLTRDGFEKTMQSMVFDSSVPPAVRTCSVALGERPTVAAQFATLFLGGGVHETTIGKFLDQHPGIVRAAFCTDHFISEPYLEWVDGAHSADEKAINPDLMVRRHDGRYDIVDLKTAALARANVTRGERKRRRFIDPINEGIAQLAHYAEYFATPGNAAYAKDRYGIEVKDPQLTLVVGNVENVHPAEVAEAQRMTADFTLIDYDTLMQIYLRSSCSLAADTAP